MADYYVIKEEEEGEEESTAELYAGNRPHVANK
jgi:hypothetical protein